MKNKSNVLSVFASALLLSTGMLSAAHAEGTPKKNDMTFFVTSVGSGKGADLGGLAGADQHCQTLAKAAGAGRHTWHAYLSTTADGASPAVNARDRIGKGPWRNAKGEVIAGNVEALHKANKINKQTALSEKGEVINGRGDTPNRHDMLTGSQPDGTAFATGQDMTCGNWSSSGDGAAMMGHHDRMGLRDDAESKSWNSSHASRGGCSQEALRGTGGDGLFYCFAVK
jgi:hypothetical protein